MWPKLEYEKIRGFTFSAVPWVNKGLNLKKAIEKIHSHGIMISETRVCSGVEVILYSYQDYDSMFDFIVDKFDQAISPQTIY